MELVARHYQTGGWVRLTVRAGTIAALEPADGPDEASPADEWIAPGFWDLQFNGRWGVSFSSADLTVDQVTRIVRAQVALGAVRVCPTLMTASLEVLRHGVETIARACEQDRDVADQVLGIHLEGPFLSEIDGYRGAHPRSAIRDPDWDEFQQLQDASDGRIVLLTIAPERPGALDFIRRATASGVVIALGHTAADGPTLRAAVAAGARLCTHLGNGIASTLARHPNPIWEQAALDDLSASLIADGHHLDPATLRVLARAKGPQRIILVSDTSPLAGLPPGPYGEWAVDPAGKIVVAGTPYLAGSNQGLEIGLANLLGATDLTLTEALATVTANPARLLGRPTPTLNVGQSAHFVQFRLLGPESRRGFELLRTCGAGQWAEPPASSQSGRP